MQINKNIGINRVHFNPNGFKRAYKQYLDGRYADLIAMMKQTEIDSHIGGCLLGRRAGIMKDWAIIPFDDTDAAKQRAEWTKGVIKLLNERKLFKLIQTAFLFKFQVIDFDWDIVDNRQAPIKLNKYEQKYFRYDVENDGELKIDFGNRLEDIPEDALVVETDETPVLLSVLRDFILKEFGVEIWASFMETFGEPLIIGKYPPGTNEADITALKSAVVNLARAARGVMPDETNIDIIETGKNTGDHASFVSMADKGIAIRILGHANAVQDSDGMKVGTNATGYNVKREIAVDDLCNIEVEVNRLIRIIESKNWGDTKFSRFEFDKSEPINTSDRLAVLNQYYNQGGIVNPDDYRVLGITVDDEQEPLLKQDVTEWGL